MKKVFFSLCSLMLSVAVFAEAEAGMQESRQQNYLQTLIMMAAFVIFFYFILLRPEQKRRKKLEEQRSAMQKGSRVTAMGIIGIVDQVEEKTVILKMIDGSKIEVLKAAITEVEAASKN